MKKLNLFYYYGLIQKYECLQHDIFPLEQQEDFLLKKDISAIQKHSTALQCARGLPAPSTSFWNNFSKIYKILVVFVCFRESLDRRLELIYVMYDKLTLGRLIS